MSKDMNETMEEHEHKGQTAVLVAIDGELCRLLLGQYELIVTILPLGAMDD